MLTYADVRMYAYAEVDHVGPTAPGLNLFGDRTT
jgi:hypothetical protein